MMQRAALIVLLACTASSTIACGGDDDSAAPWATVRSDLPGALLSVWGTSEDDVWAVGGDPNNTGPMVTHWNGSTWEDMDTGTTGALWWVFGFEGGPIYFGGDGAVILEYDGDTFTEMTTPGTTETVFGIWGDSPNEVWAVGGNGGGSSNAFVWRLDGDEWVNQTLPEDRSGEALWKVSGRGADDVVMVGTKGLVVRWNGSEFSSEQIATESLFTVDCNSDRCITVGGFGTGLIFESEGDGWVNVTPDPLPNGMIGVCQGDGHTYAVGTFGQTLRRSGGDWVKDSTAPGIAEDLHACWIDPSGGAWAVGGQVRIDPLVRGRLHYAGAAEVHP